MQTFDLTHEKSKKAILALGAESAGNFSVFHKGKIYFSENFGDLLQDANFKKFKNELNKFLKKESIRPNIILTDLHPLYKTTKLGKELAKKYKAKHIQVQHHIAHIFSSVGDYAIKHGTWNMEHGFAGIACDGTGYGLDGKIWGGEAFAISNFQFPISKQIPNLKKQISKLKIERIGKLEDQIMIGGDLAVQEPARMLIGILSKFLNKEKIYKYTKKYYSKNEFEVLYNQLQQNFNCVETSSTGRVLDAVSVLLGFCNNKRNYKHEPIFLLERNSTVPYNDLQPKIIKTRNKELRSMKYELSTTHLFEYLIKNIKKDKKRLAATAQLYIAQGLYQICQKSKVKGLPRRPASLNRGEQAGQMFLGGGISNNKIISSYFSAKKNTGIYAGIPRGDAGLSLGQIVYFFLSNNLFSSAK